MIFLSIHASQPDFPFQRRHPELCIYEKSEEKAVFKKRSLFDIDGLTYHIFLVGPL